MNNIEAIKLLQAEKVSISIEDSRSPIEIAQALGLISMVENNQETASVVQETTDDQV